MDIARGHHDLGGVLKASEQPIDRSDHAFADWEVRIDALVMLLGVAKLRIVSVDELRRNIEALGAEAYDEMSYYERWMHALTQTLIQRGLLSIDEIGRQMEMLEKRS